jgi:uncharacterized protein YbjT (DUF2867 family)
VIALMGAAGRVGGRVADLLLQKDEQIRVLEHGRPLDELASRGAEVVRGDAANVEDLVELFDSAAAALVLLPDNVAEERFVALRSTIAGSIADALRRQPVGHVVMLSTVGVDRPDVPAFRPACVSSSSSFSRSRRSTSSCCALRSTSTTYSLRCR